MAKVIVPQTPGGVDTPVLPARAIAALLLFSAAAAFLSRAQRSSVK